ncbi:MAG: methyltransferase domain-containing protein, partial [Isosphaeraceae bacterium]
DKARVVAMLQRGNPDQTIRTLDCGCGNAFFTHQAALRGSTCLGITIHEWERQSCEEMRVFLDVPESIMQFRTCTLEQLSREADQRGQFDQVLLFDVLEHIRDDQRCLEQVHALLNEDGLLYITVPNRDWQGNADHLRVTRKEDGWHVRNGYAMEQLEQLLESNGFEPVDRLRIGHLGSTLVTRIQHRLFRSRIDPLTVLFYPILKPLAVLCSVWNDPHTNFVLARRRTPSPVRPDPRREWGPPEAHAAWATADADADAEEVEA